MPLEWKRKITASSKSKAAISSKSVVNGASAVSKVRELAELHAGNYARKNLSPPRFTYGARGGVHTFYPSTHYHHVVGNKAIDLNYRLSGRVHLGNSRRQLSLIRKLWREYHRRVNFHWKKLASTGNFKIMYAVRTPRFHLFK